MGLLLLLFGASPKSFRKEAIIATVTLSAAIGSLFGGCE
jgi:hypothetical protein